MLLLVNSIPLTTSARKTPAQVSSHRFQTASWIIQRLPMEGAPEPSGKIKPVVGGMKDCSIVTGRISEERYGI